ncbi:MAG: type III pantothenate kinase [Planctomycetes bacterium]|nr:type III pantothenate kinase [Planctomycetota bacterium]
MNGAVVRGAADIRRPLGYHDAMNIGLLLGNSRIRLGFFEGSKITEWDVLAWDDLYRADFEELRQIFRQHTVDGVVIGSVRDDRLQALRAAMSQELRTITVAGRDFQIPVVNRYRFPEEVGIDRLLNTLAVSDVWSDTTRVILDFGTALSVTVVSPEGAFEGGLIGFGLKAAVDALRSATPRLPPAHPRKPRRFLERTTQEGLDSGLYWQMVGGIQRMLDGLRIELPPPQRVIATGGDAEILVPGLRGVDRIDPLLTLRGLLLAWERSGA